MSISKILISLADALDKSNLEKYADQVDTLIQQLSGDIEELSDSSEKKEEDESCEICDEDCDCDNCDEDCECDCHAGGDVDTESYMSHQNLAKINDMSNELTSLVDENAQFEDWLEDKISKIKDDMQEVYDYLSNNEDSNLAKDLEEDDDSFDKTASTAEYKGKKVTLNKPFRTPKGPKKFSVYVKNDKKNVVKVNFGSREMSIKRDNSSNKKSFRARHNCDNPGPRWKPRYWSCKMWSNTPVSKIIK